ncbi:MULTISPECIES: demethylmenaquinone methyltransferase [unclassified Paenibacillus]|uniref:demethylmenaquinone methyltransferase n=1 Tax=unclassified Paenibacillus TaxID=185978 RepID=UPI001AE65D67|nr:MULTISPECIES: demethylmenaquinone methyltransferase [unclassified Paenibacillus]MBP1155259.1 demethylmenaquinone methyltransferase/2-methoxy-6-polyprenyl-1,4-benzoquinol methylase [Paenibacillus sp. PvP091]MBP1169357.1 demethylmenaquinone methyltransferase/2-methoxy-6-polyprenyl-1,4-benzoquinol methylase [Paenibacillus sp. PvR098]MBP2440385.1 demethylmenaquinone methyltransferase/2-methoxy-6-polyprenyl-1,4-benzoquinol methylase [Paenibacillus sp. PvP052]
MQSKSKEQFVHSVFESIAPKYDLMNDILSFRRHKAWRNFTMKKMNVQPGSTAIDLCCGTCDWTISLAEASGTGAMVGLDFSQNMLDVGGDKIERLGLDKQIRLIRGNAMELPFEDNTFDYATIGFALRNVPDLVKVIEEMQRVVKPGGLVVSLELSKPTWQPFKSIYYFYFQKILPLLGKLIVKRYEQYKWLPESLVHFPDHKQLAEIFRKTGLANVEAYPLTGGIAALHIGKKPQAAIGTEGE